jgi:hypothetical protein
VGLVADLQALAGVFADHERDPGVRAKPKTGPRLSTGFQPSQLGRPVKATHRWNGKEQCWDPFDTDHEVLKEAGFFASIYAAVPRPEGPQAPEGMGLSIAGNCDRPSRYGLTGLPKEGRLNISDALQLLEERRSLLSFWTVSLPTAALMALAARDSWPLFQNRLLSKLRRKLQARLGLALYAGVAELQPKRSADSGFPCPHLHIVFLGRRHSRAVWAIQPDELDAMIKSAAKEAGLTEDVSFDKAGNVQAVKKSVRAYLSKYMTKGSSDVEPWADTVWETLLPRQWWCWSNACRELVRSCTIQLPTGFVAWAWRHRLRLLAEKACYLQQCEVPKEAPATYRFLWGSVSRLAALVAEWQEDEEDRLLMARQQLGIYTVMGEFLYAKPLALCEV